jgi:RHS repeat-associated protein
VNRLTQISSSSSVWGLLASFSYGYNSANQRTNNTLADNSYWVYGYDALGQVTSGKKYWSDGSPVSGQQFQYQFDTIGNRQGTDAGGDDLGANLHHAVYTPDGGGLNQYANRGVPGYVQTLGTASTSANVAVWAANGSYGQAVRKGTYFRAELTVNNAGNPQWIALTNVALKPGGSSADVVANAAGNVFVAKTPEQFGYDADGNLTNDGRWAFTWDAENRLVRMAANTAVGPQQVITFAYDWRGRRIQKQVSVNGTVTNNTAFVYDGWNPVARLNATNSAVVQSYVWGLDLSGSVQGAGGVGGLLEVSDAVNGVSFVAYDGNGNVAGLVAANNSGSSAVYEYGPFGEVLRATGPMAKANPFRFSTKYQDDETDLVYYGYRYYNASTGRWLSRDPEQESGGENLYGFLGNSPLNDYDAFGNCGANCGPDVTARVDQTVSDISTAYNNIKKAKDRCWACDAILASANSSWDWDVMWLQGMSSEGVSSPGPCADTVTYGGYCFQRYALWYFLYGEAAALCQKDFPSRYPDPIGALSRGLWVRSKLPGAGGDTTQQMNNKVQVARHFFNGAPLSNQEPFCTAQGGRTPDNKIDIHNWRWIGVKWATQKASTFGGSTAN